MIIMHKHITSTTQAKRHHSSSDWTSWPGLVPSSSEINISWLSSHSRTYEHHLGKYEAVPIEEECDEECPVEEERCPKVEQRSSLSFMCFTSAQDNDDKTVGSSSSEPLPTHPRQAQQRRSSMAEKISESIFSLIPKVEEKESPDEKVVRSLEETIVTDNDTIEDLRRQLDELRLEFKKSQNFHQFELQDAKNEVEALKKQLKVFQEEKQKENDDDDEDEDDPYQTILEETEPDEIDEKYVHKLQRKLKKLFRKLDEKRQELKDAKEAGMRLVLSYRNELKNTIETRTEIEHNLEKRLAREELKRRTLCGRYNSLLRNCHQEMALMSQVQSEASQMEMSQSADTWTCSSDESIDLESALVSDLSIVSTPSNRRQSLCTGGSLRNLSNPRTCAGRRCSTGHKPSTCSASTATSVQSASDRAALMQLQVKDKRIAMLEEEIYKKERMIMKLSMNSAQGIFDNMTGSDYDGFASEISLTDLAVVIGSTGQQI